MKNKVDTNATTHRNAKDCTCYVCTSRETQEYLNKLRDVQLQKGESTNQIGGMSNRDTGNL